MTDILIEIENVELVVGKGISIPENQLMNLHKQVIIKVTEKFDEIMKETETNDIEQG